MKKLDNVKLPIISSIICKNSSLQVIIIYNFLHRALYHILIHLTDLSTEVLQL
jgi:hypothetical protein